MVESGSRALLRQATAGDITIAASFLPSRDNVSVHLMRFENC